MEIIGQRAIARHNRELVDVLAREFFRGRHECDVYLDSSLKTAAKSVGCEDQSAEVLDAHLRRRQDRDVDTDLEEN